MSDHVAIPPDERIDPKAAVGELVGWWCERGGGHLSARACNSGSVPLYAPAGADAADVKAWMWNQEEDDE